MSTQKQLISQLNDTLAEKEITISERGLTSVDWTVYNNSTKRTRYSSVPSADVATRPLAIRKDGTWYTYGWDLTKNICEVFGQPGYIRTTYNYTPYGKASVSGDVDQPIQSSSKFEDNEIGLIYYNYRYYNPYNGKWISRDPLGVEAGVNDYIYVENLPIEYIDFLGLIIDTVWDVGNMIWDAGKIVTGAVTGNTALMTEGAVDLALDTAAAIIPGVPVGASKAARVASKKAAKQLAAKQAECFAIWNGYKQLDCKACKADCMPCSDVRVSLLCFKALAAGRLLYLRKKCDYYLERSRKRGSQIAEKGHRNAHQNALRAYRKCKSRLSTCTNS